MTSHQQPRKGLALCQPYFGILKRTTRLLEYRTPLAVPGRRVSFMEQARLANVGLVRGVGTGVWRLIIREVGKRRGEGEALKSGQKNSDDHITR
jgi:hypothetical protein